MSFQKIMEDFFESSGRYTEGCIFNRTFVAENIRKDVNAVITLSTHETHSVYEGFKVEIIHKDNGLINTMWFGFKDYLPREDFNSNYHTIQLSCGEKWYVSAPSTKDVKNMVEQIDNYIRKWS